MTTPTTQERIRKLEQQVDTLRRLAEISAFLNSRVELRPLLQHIMDMAVEIVDCEAASVLLWDDKRHQLEFAASTTLSASPTGQIRMPVPMDSIAGRIFLENRIIQVDDAKNDPRHYSEVDENIKFKTRSLLGVPLTYKDRVIGVLEAINKREMPWTDDDRNFLSIIAAQAAVAIEGTQLVSELKRANEELSQVDKLKNDFIAIASHELRTPLGVIMGYASFLQEEESASAQQHANKVLESALKLRTLVEQMVNLRYLKQSQADLHRENMTVKQLMDLLRRDVYTLMDLTSYQFEITSPDTDDIVFVDETRIVMALNNILQNAISFTEKGKRITMRAEVKGGELLLSIEDEGMGIDPSQLDRIFEEFVQIEDHMTRQHGGLGIGLSISMAIIQAHDGRIWAESDGVGHGATFIIALPLEVVL